MSVGTRIQVRRDTAANWTSNNPVLLAGEPAVETDTLKFKIGNGSTAWVSLQYQGSSSAGQPALVPTAVKTANYTAAVQDFVPVDTATTGSVTITLPTTPADGTRIGVKMVKASIGRTTTINVGGSDVFNVAAGSTSLTLSYVMQDVILQYATAGSIWYVQSADSGTNPIGKAQMFTANGTYTIPVGATQLDYVVVAGGGGGGGAGSATGATLQTGGGGGGAGAVVAGTIAVGNNTQAVVTIGPGGAGGTAGAAGGNNTGVIGTAGTNSTLVGDGTGISITAYGGSGGGLSTGASTTSVGGGQVGGAEFGTNLISILVTGGVAVAPGIGGSSGQVGGVGSGYNGGGGGGGGPATSTLGGTGGTAGGIGAAGNHGTAGGNGTAAGTAGTAAAANSGAGGGGGGGGNNNLAGGAGGAGGSGWVVIRVSA